MDNWLIHIFISDNPIDNILFTYDNTKNMTYMDIYKEIFNFMDTHRHKLFLQYNLRFDDEEVPENWFISHADNNKVSLDKLIWPNHHDITDDIDLYLYTYEKQGDDDDEDDHDDDEDEDDDDDNDYDDDDDDNDYDDDEDDDDDDDDEDEDDDDDDEPAPVRYHVPVPAPARYHVPVPAPVSVPDPVPVPARYHVPVPAPNTAATANLDLRSVIQRYRKGENVSPEELRAFRHSVNTLDEDQQKIWKERYAQRLKEGYTGIGISCEYDYAFALLDLDRNYFEVSNITDSGAAKSAGILVGDRIFFVDGTYPSNILEFKYRLLGKPSSPIELELESNGIRKVLTFNRNPSIDDSETSKLIEREALESLQKAANFGLKIQKEDNERLRAAADLKQKAEYEQLKAAAESKKRAEYAQLKAAAESKKRTDEQARVLKSLEEKAKTLYQSMKKSGGNRKRISKKAGGNRKRLSKKKYIDLTGGADNCYLYLTLADTASNDIPWGGIHITLVGSGNKIEELQRLRQIEDVINFPDGTKQWSLSRESNLRIPSGENPTLDRLIFDSVILDRLSLVLNPLLQNVKGPKGNCEKKSKWHIGFPEDQLITKLRDFQTKIIFWHLTICREIVNAEGKKEYSWEKL
jgi:hypothetical protein